MGQLGDPCGILFAVEILLSLCCSWRHGFPFVQDVFNPADYLNRDFSFP